MLKLGKVLTGIFGKMLRLLEGTRLLKVAKRTNSVWNLNGNSHLTWGNQGVIPIKPLEGLNGAPIQIACLRRIHHSSKRVARRRKYWWNYAVLVRVKNPCSGRTWTVLNVEKGNENIDGFVCYRNVFSEATLLHWESRSGWCVEFKRIPKPWREVPCKLLQLP